jgi:hypothetical protein
MEPFSLAILGAMALGASCGLRIFVAPFVLSLMVALGALEADRISLLQSPWVTLAALGLLLLELGADKIWGLDQALDAAGLVMRPLWAVGLVLAVAPVGEPVAMAAVSAGLLALFASLGKARLRLELRGLCAGESAATAVSPLLSLVEDIIVAGAVLGAVLLPPVGFGLVLSVAFVWHIAAALAARWRWQRWTEEAV